MGKVVKFVGRMTGLIGGFITDGVDGALASLKVSLALMTGNPFIIAATIGSDFVNTFLTKSGPRTPNAVPTVFRQAVSDSFMIYGMRRVGGLMVFFHPRKAGGKHYRYFVIAVAGHRCQGVVTWMLNDEAVTVDGAGKVTSGAYANKCWLWFQRGLASETANATFVAECGGKWTASHRGDGVAAIYAKFEMTDDVVEAGMPNITAVIEGKDDIVDYRDDSTGYTRNAVLVFYDWLQTPREHGGFGAYDDEIPDAAYISAQANVCDETVETEPRYALDAVIVTGATPSSVRDALVVNCAGTYTYSGGKHLMRPGYYVPASESLSEDDFAGALRVSPFLTSDNAINEVQGSYVDPSTGYQSAAFTTQTTDPAPDDIRQGNLDLAFTTSKNQADRIAQIAVKRGQYEKTLTCPMNVMGLKVMTLDTVTLDTERYGLSAYEFMVKGWTFSSDMGIVLALREENALIYGEPVVVPPDEVPDLDDAETIITDADLQTRIRTVYAGGVTLTGQEVGGDGRIVISDHFYDWPGIEAVAATGTTLTGLTLTGTYYVWADIDEPADATPTFGATTDYASAINSAAHPLRIFLGQVIIIPALGAPDTNGTGHGGGYGGGDGIILDEPIE